MKRMIKTLSFLVAAVLLLTMSMAGATGVSGVYEGVGQGRGGEIRLEVTLENSAIKDIKVLAHNETPGFDTAMDAMTKEVIGKNSAAPEAVSGATLTSQGFVEALTDALSKAGLTPADLVAKEVTAATEKTEVTEDHQVVVIGAGGAGLIAAIKAKEKGAEVIVLEKMSFAGGNTLISGAEYAAPGNEIQKKEGIEDNADKLYDDVLVAGGRPELIRVLADKALEGANWLHEDAGVVWEDEMMFFGGHSVKRSLVPQGASGKEIITKLLARVEALGVPVLLNTKATALIMKDGAVVGVKAEGPESNYTLNAKSVVIATGGFGANADMRAANAPDLAGITLTTNAVGSTGDGILMAESVGAGLTDMEKIQLYPICNPLTGALLYADDTRLYGGTIIVNKEGKRFVEELDTRYAISMGILAQTGHVCYELWDDTVTKDSKILENHAAEIKDLKEKDLLVVADTLDEAAAFFGVDAAVLKETVERFNGYVEGGKDLEFNKRGKLFKIETAPFYLMKAAPAVHHTMGGIQITPQTQVTKADGTVIPGLFAAGEVTGGIHGKNRLGSVAITDITVFGGIAGESAATYALDK